jgi:hypothetical protein
MLKKVAPIQTQAVVENLADRGQNSPLSKAPKQIVRAGNQGSAGKMNLGVVKQNGNSARYAKFTLDNSAGETAASYLIGDACGLVAAVKSLSASAPTMGRSVTHAAFKSFLLARTLTVSGFRYQTDNVADLNNDIVVYNANISGEVQENVLNIQDSVNSKDYDPKIQNFEAGWTFDETTGILVTVGAGHTVYITIWFDGQF